MYLKQGIESTPAKRLNNAAFPSMTGIAASGPMLPKPKTAEPSLIIYDGFSLLLIRKFFFMYGRRNSRNTGVGNS